MREEKDKFRHLNPVSRIKSNAGVRFLTDAAYPGNHCPMHTALALSSKIKGLSTLLIGTAECTTYARLVIPASRGESGELHWMYLMDSNEVIFGCRKGLIDAVKEMERENAEAVLIIVTCVPEAIGEDIEGIIHEVQPGIKAKLTFVLMGHFKCNSYPSGSWKTMLSLGHLMDKKQTVGNIVNVLGRSPLDDHTPVPDILQSLTGKGFQINYLAPEASLSDFLDAPKARLNIVLSVYTQALAESMKERFDIPLISLHDVYGIAEIDRRYMEIGILLNLDFGDEFEEGRAEALALEQEVSEACKGMKFVCGNIGSTAVLPFSLYLARLGMEPLLLHIEEVYPKDSRYMKRLNELGFDPLACHMVDPVADADLLNELAPDLCFGIFQGAVPKFPCVGEMYELYGPAGYLRTRKLLKKIKEAVRGAYGGRE